MPYTTGNLLTEIKQRAAIPASQETYTNADLLRLATNELYTYVVPILMSVREEYLVLDKEYTVTSATTQVTLPDRAVAGAVRDVRFRRSGGSSTDEVSVPYIAPERIGRSAFRHAGFAVYFKWDTLVIAGTAPTGTLVVPYCARPGELADISTARAITSIDTATSTVSFSSLPSTYDDTKLYDFISARGIYPYLAIDQTASSVSGSDMVFSSLPDDLSVGDYVTLAGETPLAQIPREFQPLLAQRVVTKVLESQGDHSALERARRDLDETETRLVGVIQPRNPGEAEKIVSRSVRTGWAYGW